MAVMELKEMHQLDEQLAKAGRKLVVVIFSSQNCGPCRPIPACVKALSEEMPDVLFIKIEVGKCDEFTERFKILGVPMFYFYRNGCEEGHFAGGNLGHLKKTIDQLRFNAQCS